MQIPETPSRLEDLNLMKRLREYASGSSWYLDGVDPGSSAKQACEILCVNITNLINNLIAPLLDRITSREFETFTMHDHRHGLKVAHLMWHILSDSRQNSLTPPEIGLLVYSAFMHDLGMALSPMEREAYLSPTSDIWTLLDFNESAKQEIDNLRKQASDSSSTESARALSRRKLQQAEEVLLSQLIRENHASKERYIEIIDMLNEFHRNDPTRIPNVESSLSFDGFSFKEKLIDICVSHNLDSDVLVQSDENNIYRALFPDDYPIGFCQADLKLVAAALRISDILDFDRERTPTALFHYLLPGALEGLESISALEWSKHLAITSWSIETEEIVYHARCENHIIHHAIVQFCDAISKEITATETAFYIQDNSDLPFRIPSLVKADIYEIGYHYVPYQFELDDQRIYELLMGGAIYGNPLAAVRELVQNAVDACKLSDALTRLYNEHIQLSATDRILIKYEEATRDCPYPKLTVKDTGTGMDKWIIERYFLKIGQSYYNSPDFGRIRSKLHAKNLDFAPVSEFGIGFLSTFLLADRVVVETALWEPIRSDSLKRVLHIDGPTRLIRLEEHKNDGPDRFKGTSITLFLTNGSTADNTKAPSWKEIRDYLKTICLDLPYMLNLEYISKGGLDDDIIKPQSLKIDVPKYLQPAALHIPVDNKDLGFEGDIVLIDGFLGHEFKKNNAAEVPIYVQEKDSNLLLDYNWKQGIYPGGHDSILLRGGFNIGFVPGLPDIHFHSTDSIDNSARIRLAWQFNPSRKYIATNLARNATVNEQILGNAIAKEWLSYLLSNVYDLPDGFINHYALPYYLDEDKFWPESFDAYTVYLLGRNGWSYTNPENKELYSDLLAWEDGKGSPLMLGEELSYLSFKLLMASLLLVTVLQWDLIGPDRPSYFVKPPDHGWRDILKGRPVSSIKYDHNTAFAEYAKSISHGLYYTNTMGGPFNLAFKYRLNGFTKNELSTLARIIDGLIHNEIYTSAQTILSKPEAAVFKRALDTVGDLEVGFFGKFRRLDTFRF